MMVMGDYCIIMEVTEGLLKPIDFDTITNIYFYVEPTISTTIILIFFSNRRSKLLKSFEALNRVCNQLKDLNINVSLTYTKLAMYVFFGVEIVVAIIWIVISCIWGNLIVMIYESSSFGLAFSIQATINMYLIFHMIISLSAFNALNTQLRKMDKQELMGMLKTAGVVYSDLVKAYADIFHLCSPTLVSFLFRAYFQFCLVLMILCGVLPKTDDNTWVSLILHSGASFLFAFMNEALYKMVSGFLLKKKAL